MENILYIVDNLLFILIFLILCITTIYAVAGICYYIKKTDTINWKIVRRNIFILIIGILGLSLFKLLIIFISHILLY